LFGAEVGLIAAALWAFDPNAIGFNRIAKEDTFLLFFFLLANVFWLRSQRIAESCPEKRPQPYYWASAAAYGAMMASKYLPQLIGITISYYWLFQAIPDTRWRLGKKRMLLFFVVMGIVFLLCNPTILLPGTWRQVGLFAGQKLIGHDGYEFMGQIYPHRVTDWLRGIPWYFYFVFIAVKLPLLTLAGFFVGFPLLFRRKTGDGRYFLLFWMFFWAMSFTFVGGKFTRYFTVALPAVLITAAIGVQYAGRRIAQFVNAVAAGASSRAYVSATIALCVLLPSVLASANAAPHFRLYLNSFGGGITRSGYYFPHDDFYDASMRDLLFDIAARASSGARIASESPSLARYYSIRANRSDLVCLELSDPEALGQLEAGDFIVIARGRRYFSNDLLIDSLHHLSSPVSRFSLGEVPSAEVYQLNQVSLSAVREVARQMPPLAKVPTGTALP
jgi:Dolichyl-phosphate-mannose-protein mannosyltransferase